MRLIMIFLSAMLLLSCFRAGRHHVIAGTAITGWDGITVIKAYQEKFSNKVEVHIMMRPEMKNNISVLWHTIDSDHKVRQYKSPLREGRPMGISIAVTPGSHISEIRITGYEKVAA
jgi:hypothetical protein